MIITILSIFTLSLVSCALALELKRDLMMFQQNSYRNERYQRWLSESKDTTSWQRITALIVMFIILTGFGNLYITNFLIIIAGIVAGYNLYGKKYKKPLVWTARAKRIYAVAIVLVLAIGLFASSLLNAAAFILACYCGSHIIVMASNIILTPIEKLINRHYYNDARSRLQSMPDLKIIGITGSYGKTSTKHYLHRILSEQFDTLMTPGSFNTTMGVIRTVREYLKPYNEVFIVEMGAKSRGDVKEICDLVKPTMGIITAVGPQHLESFKTIENVQKAKFELADALPADGLAVVNNDFEMIANRQVNNCDCIRYSAADAEADYKAVNIKYSAEGTTFTVESSENWSIDISTRLMGECNVSDLLAAIIVAHKLGVSDSKIVSAIASIEPVEHRLSVKRTPGGITILDDAFNSNPVGSRMALEVLGSMTTGKRIVITPGMIELGAQQYELNYALGESIAKHTDIAIVVGKYNREAITEGIRTSGEYPEENLRIVDTFAEAQQVLSTIATSGDIILYENDLPDTFK